MPEEKTTTIATPQTGWQVFEYEVNLIYKPEIKEFVKKALDAAPPQFWTMPASKTGKYHGEDNNRTGGLVHHTKKLVYALRVFIRAMQLEGMRDELIAAGILHDIVKDGSRVVRYGAGGNANWKDHGVCVAQFVSGEVYAGTIPPAGISGALQSILRLCAVHMGQWGSGPETMPRTRAEWAIHMADMMASRKGWIVNDINQIHIPEE